MNFQNIFKILKKEKHQREIKIVTGLPRSGTSLMMNILKKSQEQIFYDDFRKPDSNNPNGYFESQKVKEIIKDSNIIETFADMGWVKITANYLSLINFKSSINFKLIFMIRNVDEILISQNKMSGAEISKQAREDLENLRDLTLELFSDKKNIEVITVDYENLVTNPDSVVKSLSFFNINAKESIELINNKLYRSKK